MNKKKYDYLPLRYDVTFKGFFAKTSHKKFLLALLNQYLNLDIANEADIKLLATELPPISSDGKMPTLDLRVKLKNGEQINIEMQLISKDYFLKRIYYYNTKLYSEQLKSGEDYNKLKKTISLIFTLYDVFTEELIGKTEHLTYINNAGLYHKESGKLLLDDVNLCFVELSRYQQLLKNNKVERDCWADLLLADSDEKLVALSERSDIMAEAVKELKYFSEDDVARYWTDMYEKAERDRRAERSYALRKAREEARKEAREEVRKARELALIEGEKNTQQKIALNLLKQELDIAIISSATNLSSNELINLQKQL